MFSFQDILENDDINLDSMFVASFVMDLIKVINILNIVHGVEKA